MSHNTPLSPSPVPEDGDTSPRRPAPPQRPWRVAPGRVILTDGVLALAVSRNVDLWRLLARHLAGDWGDLDPEDRAINEAALRRGGRRAQPPQRGGVRHRGGEALGVPHQAPDRRGVL